MLINTVNDVANITKEAIESARLIYYFYFKNNKIYKDIGNEIYNYITYTDEYLKQYHIYHGSNPKDLENYIGFAEIFAKNIHDILDVIKGKKVSTPDLNNKSDLSLDTIKQILFNL